MWNLSEELILMNLGNEFYLIRFQDEQNYIKILQGGPWFIGKHLLTIGHWEPKFNASTSKCLQTAIWARLPALPTEL